MDRFIRYLSNALYVYYLIYFINFKISICSKLTKDYEKLTKPNTADYLSHYIRTYMHIYKYLYRSFEMVRINVKNA